jgi:hypothetical protein
LFGIDVVEARGRMQTLERIAAGWPNKNIDALRPSNFSPRLTGHGGRLHNDRTLDKNEFVVV